ncbi:MAG: zf-TFIIB domain-containing protein [Holophagaceae bacterium]|nr:zf-TFIIB domain-containing protein [Holophagaceae bacterium]
MEARAMRCSACGALVDENSPSCPYCRATLSRVACPKCFGHVPVNARHCPACGNPVGDESESEQGELLCPNCKLEMETSTLGDIKLHNCGRCGGSWLDNDIFENLSADREQRGRIFLGLGSNVGSVMPETTITYRPCPVCHKLMNRFNYAKISGVILDLCKTHGVWFDKDELGAVINFIEKGGLVKAQQRQQMKLEDAQRDARSAIASMPMDSSMYDSSYFRKRKGQVEFTDVVNFIDDVIGFFKKRE